MSKILACSFVAVLAVVSFAAPNLAINRIDAPGHNPHSTTISSETVVSSSTVPHISLKPREPAVNRIDAVGVNVHHTATSDSVRSTSLRTLVSTTMGPQIALNPRNPAVNRIDAVAVHANHRTTTSSKITESSVSLRSSSIRPHITLNPRDPAVNRIDAPGYRPHFTTLTSSATATRSWERPRSPVKERAPAVNRIDAVGDVVADQALFDVPGGTPVTLAISDIQQLEAAASETVGAVAFSMPVVSVNPSPENTAVPASFFASPPPSSSAIPFEVPDTQTVIYITLHPDLPIPKTDMGHALVHAMLDLRETIKLNRKDGWLPKDNWSWFDIQWNCLLTADRNLIPAPGGREQHLTYGILHSALVGLWGAMYSQGRYFACDFAIRDAQWGVVGSGRMAPWDPVVGNSTTS